MTVLANQADALALARLGAHFYVGHSGGKDSQAMYAALSAIIPADQLHVVHADLGEVEWDGVKEHITETISHPLTVVQAIHADGTPKTFFSAVRARRAALDAQGKGSAPAFPSSASRFCTSDLKTTPIWKHIRNDGHRLVVNCVGIRGQESKARAKKIAQRGTLNENRKNTNSKRTAYDWWPLAHWSIQDVWAEIARVGQSPHPAYAMGNDRLSCVFCIFGSRGDLQRGARVRPELVDKYAQLELDVRSTLFSGSSLLDIVEVS